MFFINSIKNLFKEKLKVKSKLATKTWQSLKKRIKNVLFEKYYQLVNEIRKLKLVPKNLKLYRKHPLKYYSIKYYISHYFKFSKNLL